jgi:argininosuccinate lyase
MKFVEDDARSFDEGPGGRVPSGRLHATAKGFLDATVLAEYLVARGAPFREAHQHVGRLVATAEKDNRELQELSLDEFQKVCPDVDKDVYRSLGANNIIRAYRSEGSAGIQSTRRQIRFWSRKLDL